MKYQGEVVKKTSTKEVLITRDGAPDMRVTVTALPLGFEEGAESEIPSPEPKVIGFLRDRKGKPLRDPQTGKPIPETDENSSEFLQKTARVNRLQTVRLLYEGLRGDVNLTFEAVKSDFPNPADFYEAIFTEMKEAGFNSGDYLKLARAVIEVSGLSPEQIQEAVEDFLSSTS